MFFMLMSIAATFAFLIFHILLIVLVSCQDAVEAFQFTWLETGYFFLYVHL